MFERWQREKLAVKAPSPNALRLLGIILTNSLICLAPVDVQSAAAGGNRRATPATGPVSGRITAINLADKTVSIGNRTVSVGRTTMIVKGSKPLELRDLKEGMAVSVETFRLADRVLAVTILLNEDEGGQR